MNVFLYILHENVWIKKTYLSIRPNVFFQSHDIRGIFPKQLLPITRDSSTGAYQSCENVTYNNFNNRRIVRTLVFDAVLNRWSVMKEFSKFPYWLKRRVLENFRHISKILDKRTDIPKGQSVFASERV